MPSDPAERDATDWFLGSRLNNLYWAAIGILAAFVLELYAMTEGWIWHSRPAALLPVVVYLAGTVLILGALLLVFQLKLGDRRRSILATAGVYLVGTAWVLLASPGGLFGHVGLLLLWPGQVTLWVLASWLGLFPTT